MTAKLKKLRDQAIVITGATSGIGLATARMAAARGARLVLAARSENALRQLIDEIRRGGGRAVYVVADVSKRADVQRIADAARKSFGGFDTWINNAGVGMYGRLEEVSVEDMRHLFDINLWGVIYGSLEAVKHLKGRGGALINVGSTVSERAVPLQGIYSSSKHAVKGFTDALRMELESEGAPVSVSLVKPGAIDTPFTLNAKNYLESEPQHVPPVYAPETVARAILHCAETPVRDVFVGAGGKGQAALGQYAPRLADKFMEKTVISGTKSGRPPRPRVANGLNRPSENLAERGNYPGHVAKTSLYTAASLRPVLTGLSVVGAGIAVAALVKANGGSARRGATAEDDSVSVERSITIGKSADELYRRWREPQTLPLVMNHFADVAPTSNTSQHWKVNGPLGQSIEWDTRITEEQSGEFVRWQSTEGASLPNDGSVSFRPAPGGRGTEVTLRFRFNLPNGAAGVSSQAAKLLGALPDVLATKALRRFKSFVETGELPTLEQNPSARGKGDTVTV